eukprot:gnl/MRDRNA2_/MRDRNA2_104356_c0_seq1.p1 gnl/MRDRNA2_/MRDRNA2_104356_c0~~gnl/MRDRNA2_/MRDRNA2_104356_c0_seq1.p1  ORF type:complete len:449 (-),score=108.59 gnl/MRDRNA2_/MRDRNA2_104356_c0_seq1:47-1393(-)
MPLLTMGIHFIFISSHTRYAKGNLLGKLLDRRDEQALEKQSLEHAELDGTTAAKTQVDPIRNVAHKRSLLHIHDFSVPIHSLSLSALHVRFPDQSSLSRVIRLLPSFHKKDLQINHSIVPAVDVCSDVCMWKHATQIEKAVGVWPGHDDKSAPKRVLMDLMLDQKQGKKAKSKKVLKKGTQGPVSANGNKKIMKKTHLVQSKVTSVISDTTKKTTKSKNEKIKAVKGSAKSNMTTSGSQSAASPAKTRIGSAEMIGKARTMKSKRKHKADAETDTKNNIQSGTNSKISSKTASNVKEDISRSKGQSAPAKQAGKELAESNSKDSKAVKEQPGPKKSITKMFNEMIEKQKAAAKAEKKERSAKKRKEEAEEEKEKAEQEKMKGVTVDNMFGNSEDEWIDDGLGGQYRKKSGFTGRYRNGMPVYKDLEAFTKRKDVGKTKLCPFDCWCCF